MDSSQLACTLTGSRFKVSLLFQRRNDIKLRKLKVLFCFCCLACFCFLLFICLFVCVVLLLPFFLYLLFLLLLILFCSFSFFLSFFSFSSFSSFTSFLFFRIYSYRAIGCAWNIELVYIKKNPSWNYDRPQSSQLSEPVWTNPCPERVKLVRASWPPLKS